MKPWHEITTEEVARTLASPKRGRVLKVKLGYNPNSSSIGTTAIVFLWSLAAATTALATVAGLLLRSRRFARVGERAPEPDASGGAPARPESGTP